MRVVLILSLPRGFSDVTPGTLSQRYPYNVCHLVPFLRDRYSGSGKIAIWNAEASSASLQFLNAWDGCARPQPERLDKLPPWANASGCGDRFRPLKQFRSGVQPAHYFRIAADERALGVVIGDFNKSWRFKRFHLQYVTSVLAKRKNRPNFLSATQPWRLTMPDGLNFSFVSVEHGPRVQKADVIDL